MNKIIAEHRVPKKIILEAIQTVTEQGLDSAFVNACLTGEAYMPESDSMRKTLEVRGLLTEGEIPDPIRSLVKQLVPNEALSTTSAQLIEEVVSGKTENAFPKALGNSSIQKKHEQLRFALLHNIPIFVIYRKPGIYNREMQICYVQNESADGENNPEFVLRKQYGNEVTLTMLKEIDNVYVFPY